MKRWFLTTLVFGVALLTISYPLDAKAGEWDKKTELTFSAPVELPGVVLSPGTYIFKLLDSGSDRNIVQVFSKDGTKLYATILAIPDYRPTTASKPIVRFEERSTGAPEAIKAWFYPGDEYGQEFAYPKSRAVQLAKTTNQNIVTIPNETAQNIMKPAKTPQEPPVVALKTAPVTAVNPKGAEVELAQAATPKPSGTAATKQAPPAQAEAKPTTHPNTATELPKTASTLPLVLLIGLIALGLSLNLWLLRRPIG